MKIALLCSKINQNDIIFNKIGESEVTFQGGYVELKRKLEEKGYQFHTIDKFKNYKEIDVAICDFSMTTATHELLQLIKVNPHFKFLYYMQEPETVVALHNKKIMKFLGIFDAILCLRDELIDNQRFFKIFPAQRELSSYFLNYKTVNKKGICLINSYYKKPRFQPIFGDLDELYSQRYKVMEYFKDYPGFHLYGKKWHKFENQAILKNIYKGVVENKINTMSQYKFSICFESQICNGYVSEKIFDSFFAFCIPIYWGAKNICDYVPKNCFIDFTEFKSLADLQKYLDNMSDTEYHQYLDNIENYLKSSLYAKNSSQEFSSNLLKHIESDKPVIKKSFYRLKLKMLLLSIFYPRRVYNNKQRRFIFDTLFYW